MYSLLAYNRYNNELDTISRIFKNEMAYYTDELLKIIACTTQQEIETVLDKKHRLDIVCYDITTKNGIFILEQIRKQNKNAFVILVATSRISPLEYMKPSIMAASLLLRPISETSVKAVADAVIQVFVSETNEEIFVVGTDDGDERIPYEDIVYFESRNKKVYCCTRYKEYGFYATLDKLEQMLPDFFKRCHRSFILNTRWIRKIALSENVIYLRENYEIPVSRSYKAVMKGYR